MYCFFFNFFFLTELKMIRNKITHIPDGSENSLAPVDDVSNNVLTYDTDEGARVQIRHTQSFGTRCANHGTH